jgi:hypothetical protein
MQRAGDVPLVKQLAPPFMARALRTPPPQNPAPPRFAVAGRVETAEPSLSFRMVDDLAHRTR